jgi:hypothetical protein
LYLSQTYAALSSLDGERKNDLPMAGVNKHAILFGKLCGRLLISQAIYKTELASQF